MSITQSIAMHKKKLPSTSALEAQAKHLGFDLTIDDVDLASFEGFVARKLSSRKAGFMWAIEDTEVCKHLGIKIGSRDCVATLSTSSSAAELQSALIVAASRLILTKGVFFDDLDNVTTVPDPILETVCDLMKGGKK